MSKNIVVGQVKVYPVNWTELGRYLEMVEVNALIAAAPNPKARLIMLEQWRAGLRVSEALALEARDLHLD